MTDTKTESGSGGGLKAAFQDTMSALGDRAVHSAQQRISGLTDKLNESGGGTGGAGKIAAKAAEAGAQGDSPVKGAVKGAVSAGKDKITDKLPGKGGGNKRKPPAATKAMNIVESIDVGVPAKVAFNQWTQYDEWPSFMKKVEHAELQDSDQDAKVNTKLHVFWFRRTQESTIQDQIPDERILWRSNGQKGHVDGCVSFHEIGPRLTRILVTLEYYPKGFVERVGNIWRAQGRRLRLELKHFRRHVMMSTILSPDEAEGWRGEVEDGEVIRSHDEVVEEEDRQAEEESSDQDGQGDEGQDDQDQGDQDEGDQDQGDQDEGDQDQGDQDQGDQDAADQDQGDQGDQGEGDQDQGDQDQGDQNDQEGDDQDADSAAADQEDEGSDEDSEDVSDEQTDEAGEESDEQEDEVSDDESDEAGEESDEQDDEGSDEDQDRAGQ